MGSQKLKNKKTVLSLKSFQSLPLFTLSPSKYIPLPVPLPNSLSFKNLIPKIKWITPQSSLSLPAATASFISTPTSAVGSHSHCLASPIQRDRPLYPLKTLKITFTLFLASPSVWTLENLRHFLTTDSATQRRKGGRDASILLGLLKEFIPINSLFLRVYSKIISMHRLKKIHKVQKILFIGSHSIHGRAVVVNANPNTIWKHERPLV